MFAGIGIVAVHDGISLMLSGKADFLTGGIDFSHVVITQTIASLAGEGVVTIGNLEILGVGDLGTIGIADVVEGRGIAESCGFDDVLVAEGFIVEIGVGGEIEESEAIFGDGGTAGDGDFVVALGKLEVGGDEGGLAFVEIGQEDGGSHGAFLDGGLQKLDAIGDFLLGKAFGFS